MHRSDFINAARFLKIRTRAIFFRPLKPQNLSTCRSLASSNIFFYQLAVWKHVADDFRKFITNTKRQVVLLLEHCKFCLCKNKFIAFFWLSFDFFFRLQCLFMIFGGDMFRYVILSSPSYATMSILQELDLAYRVFIPFMASTYERKIFLQSLLVLAAIPLFLLLAASSCNSR